MLARTGTNAKGRRIGDDNILQGAGLRHFGSFGAGAGLRLPRASCELTVIVEVSAEHAAAVLAGARDGDLTLALDTIYQPDGSPWMVPACRFDICLGDARAGTISLRVGSNERLVRSAGHVGYAIDEAWRGQQLARRAVRLLLTLARSHGLDPLWITCNPDNRASRRTIERLGAVYVETVELPPDHDRYDSRGEREKCRYRLDLGRC